MGTFWRFFALLGGQDGIFQPAVCVSFFGAEPGEPGGAARRATEEYCHASLLAGVLQLGGTAVCGAAPAGYRPVLVFCYLHRAGAAA